MSYGTIFSGGTTSNHGLVLSGDIVKKGSRFSALQRVADILRLKNTLPPNPAFQMTINNSSSGFTLPLVAGQTYNFVVNWGDGSSNTITSYNQAQITHTYANDNSYQISITGTMPRMRFNFSASSDKVLSIDNWGNVTWNSLNHAFSGCSNLISVARGGVFGSVTDFNAAFQNCSSLTTFPLINTSSGTTFELTWSGCTSLTSFPCINTGNATSLFATWNSCTSLTSFPLINTSGLPILNATWANCYSLTSFPLINTSSCTSLQTTWASCIGLMSFPLINTSNVTSFNCTWQACTGLTSFPLINTGSALYFDYTWDNCSGLINFPLINTSICTRFQATWGDCISLTSFPSISINTSVDIIFAEVFRRCSSLASVGALNLSKALNLIDCFKECPSLSSVSITGVVNSINLVNSSLSASSINTIFSNLGTVSSKTIYVFGNAGSLTCDTSIATSKGWTVKTVIMAAPVLSAPSTVSDPNTYTISWTAISGAVNYEIFISEDNITWDSFYITPSLSYLMDYYDCIGGYHKVRAIDANNIVGSFSNVKRVIHN